MRIWLASLGLLWLAVEASAEPSRMGFGTHKPPSFAVS